jgi:hypothetical protein
VPWPNPTVVFLTDSSVVAFKFDGSEMLIIGAKKTLLSKKTHRTTQNFMGSKEVLIYEFDKNIISIDFHPTLETTLFITFEDETQEVLDFRNPPPSRRSNINKLGIITENHVTILIVGVIITAFLCTILYGIKMYFKDRQSSRSINYQPVSITNSEGNAVPGNIQTVPTNNSSQNPKTDGLADF